MKDEPKAKLPLTYGTAKFASSAMMFAGAFAIVLFLFWFRLTDAEILITAPLIFIVGFGAFIRGYLAAGDEP